MSNFIEYNSLMAFHPGYYIAEIIDDMEISQEEFATRMGTTPKTLSLLLAGKANLSNDLAGKLSTMLGISIEFWLNLQKSYNEKLVEIAKAKELDEQKKIVDFIDYKFFVDVAGLPATKSKEEKVYNLCSYLKISNLNILKRNDFLVNFRTGISDVKQKNLINARAWIQTALNFAQSIEVQPFNADKLKEYIPEIRQMTLQSPDKFVPRLKEIFSECGVAFVILPYLKNSGINGAVKWIGSDRVVLAINNRGLASDTFWFSLFHEIKHVLQQKLKTVFISSDEEVMHAIDKKLENDADTFAQNCLIGKKEFTAFRERGNFSRNSIIIFAEQIGVQPGIVVGRLQHDKLIDPSWFSDLRIKYIILTDRQNKAVI